MLLKGLFSLFFGFFDFVLGLIPTFPTIDLSILQPLTTVFCYINIFVDTRVLLIIFATVLLRDNFIFFKNMLLAIYNKIPFFN